VSNHGFSVFGIWRLNHGEVELVVGETFERVVGVDELDQEGVGPCWRRGQPSR
jgi:hypothetical protein